MNFIDLKSQYQKIETPINEAIKRVLEHGRYINGPEVQEAEEKLAEYAGVKHCVLLGNGTDALLVSLLAVGMKPGDEIIVPAFSFFGTAGAVSLLNGTPIFVDIDADTYNIDASKIEAAITDKTKAIMPVSLYGQCADMDVINSIAAKHNLPVIEDGAQSYGATYKNKFSCNLSTMATTSFYPAKPLGAYGDAGAFFSNDDEIAQIARELKEHGGPRAYHHIRIGMNGRCDSIQAAIILEKLKIYKQEVELRQAAAAYYSENLSSLVKTPKILDGNTSSYAQYTIELDDRDKFREFAQEKGVPTAVHYPMSMNKQPVYMEMGYGAKDYLTSDTAASRVVSLPMHPYLAKEEQDKVISTVKEYLGA